MGQSLLIRILIITALSTLLTSKTGSMIYAGEFGPPEPMTREGKVGLAVGYFYSSTKLDPENGNRLARQHEVKNNQIYLEAGYGFLKNWEAYLRLGSSDLKLEKAFPFAGQRGSSETFKDSFGPFGALGVKGLFYDGAYIGVGSFFQAGVSPCHKDKSGTYTGGPPACDLDPGAVCVAVVGERSDELKVKSPWDVNLGIGLQTKVYGITLYGGPFAYWTGYKAEYKLKFSGNPNITDETHYREKNNFGGFVGLRAPLPWTKGVSVEVEGQFKNKGSVGISLNYSL